MASAEATRAYALPHHRRPHLLGLEHACGLQVALGDRTRALPEQVRQRPHVRDVDVMPVLRAGRSPWGCISAPYESPPPPPPATRYRVSVIVNAVTGEPACVATEPSRTMPPRRNRLEGGIGGVRSSTCVGVR